LLKQVHRKGFIAMESPIMRADDLPMRENRSKAVDVERMKGRVTFFVSVVLSFFAGWMACGSDMGDA
jgi:hypothetical protein